MRKLFLLSIIITVFLSAINVHSVENSNYQAYLADSSIYLNLKEQLFLNPVVVVNGYTYIPLRELCEKFDIDIEWNEHDSQISLKHDFAESEKFEDENDIKSLFNMFFKTDFPESAEILHYDYGYLGEAYFRIKLIIDKSDMEQLKDNIDFDSVSDLSEDAVNREIGTLKYLSNNSSWWDLTALDENTLCAFAPNCQGFHARSITAKFFIVEYSENEYYLYAYYY